MIYEVWFYPSTDCFTLVRRDNNYDLLETGDVLIFTFKANSFEEASSLHKNNLDNDFYINLIELYQL